jgi:D-3-phosphoglycerate dehydrogenase / 2-oxoglutarate reductase
MSRPIVLIAEELSPAAVDALGPDVEIRYCNGADRRDVLAAVKDADAILIRSATRVEAEVLTAAGRLKVIARAGVGLDNVDVPAATEAGVLVVNAAYANAVSAAELACGLLIATARNIPQAGQALKNGEWNRSKYGGVELAHKTLGVLGLGRIGALVAERMTAFGMKMVAHDPYVDPARAARLGVQILPLDEFLAASDFLTVHLPKTPQTLGLIGSRELLKVKRGVRLVNAARGGIVDEEALYAALVDGRVAAAGLDVYAQEPCTDSPLLKLDQVVCTPHLGASTREAQDRAGVSVAESVRLALGGARVPDAVNEVWWHGTDVFEAHAPVAARAA